MWKSILVATTLIFFGFTNCYAADFGYAEDPEPVQTSKLSDFSISEIVNGLNITDTMRTELLFGLDEHTDPGHDGPDASPSTMGIGLGFSFSF
ncbi:hypothetical protein [Maridesulfovibrio sp.]|uniref:hypothetical protein n=1 Tax=Maridesulfovibrio sp. TaxID=2795000 RepID=UPI0039EF6249